MQSYEKWYPLRVLVCDKCWLVQTEDFVEVTEMFSDDYAYFSSFSTTLLKHSSNYVNYMVDFLNLNTSSSVVEVAANDGYLLQYFKQKKIQCYGIEPTHSTANAARDKGIEIVEEFFGVNKAEELRSARGCVDLMVANNVLAHVPDINDFVRGFSILLKPNGVVTFEFPHLLNLVSNSQFDTIYHEHYSYLSLTSVKTICENNGLCVFKVDTLPTHGESLRVYAQRLDTGNRLAESSVKEFVDIEENAGIKGKNFYESFQIKTNKIKNDFMRFLLQANAEGKIVVGYGAAAKANTLMNFAGVRSDLLSYVVDKNPDKQDKFLPGNRIPIVSEDKLKRTQPDYVVIFPWNLFNEIEEQLNYIRQWGGQFVVVVPQVSIK
jgi:SAM-dependent methyltransferase